MQILDFIMVTLFVIFMIFIILGFNMQMREKARLREEKRKKND